MCTVSYVTSQKNLVMISSMITFQLNPELQIIIYLSLMGSIINFHLILTVIYIYIFTLNSLMLHRTSIFINSVYPVICHHPLLCLPLLLVHSILLQNHKLKLYLNIPGLVDITVMEVCLMEINSKREHFGFLISVLNLLRSFNTLNYWIMTTLKLIFNPFLKKVYFFVVVLSKITYYDSCMLHSFLTDIYAKASTLMQ